QAGLSVGTLPVAPAVDPTYSFPQSMVLAQTTVVPNQPKNTFGRHNAQNSAAPGAATTPPVDTVFTPFEWLPHFDRKLVNQLELIHVNGGKPHEFAPEPGPPAPTRAHVLQH